MKEAQDWMADFKDIWDADCVRAIQADAYHAGRLRGLSDAVQIVRRHDEKVKELTFYGSASEIETAYTELEKK